VPRRHVDELRRLRARAQPRLVRIAMIRIDDVDRLLAALQALEEERVDDRALLLGTVDERARVEVIAHLRVREAGGERHGRQRSTATRVGPHASP
jgi:hypothetical protein